MNIAIAQKSMVLLKSTWIKLPMFRCALLTSSVVSRKGDDEAFKELRM
jgi:hypothetical protein